MWEALNEIEGINKVGAVFILAALTTCILACAFVVYDTIRDTYETIRKMRKNKKTKN
jgi:hypothetical protein